VENIEKTIESLELKLDTLIASLEQSSQKGRSKQINELASALAKAQMGMRVASESSENPYFKSKYADLATVVKASRQYLTANGLAVVQQVVVHDDGQNILHTILLHSSGQWIESTVRIIPAKNDIQTLGSCITYLRRYSYAALVGVTAAKEDDDGELAMSPVRSSDEKGTGLNTKYDSRQESPEAISKDQLAELEYELAEYPDIAEQVLEGLRLQSLADMPKSKYRASVERVRSIKAMRNGEKR